MILCEYVHSIKCVCVVLDCVYVYVCIVYVLTILPCQHPDILLVLPSPSTGREACLPFLTQEGGGCRSRCDDAEKGKEEQKGGCAMCVCGHGLNA